MRKGFLSNFIMRWLITAIAVAVDVWIVPGIRVSQPHPIWTILVVAQPELSRYDQLVTPERRDTNIEIDEADLITDGKGVPFEIGTTIGGYRILSLIGTGGNIERS